MKNFTLLFIALFAFGTAFCQLQRESNTIQSPMLNSVNQSQKSLNTQNNFQSIERELRNSGGGCNIGNETDPGWDSGSFSANYLLGVKFTLTEEGTLNSINLIGNNSGSNVQMAVYDDNVGFPNDLVVYSGVTTVGAGVISLPVTATLMTPGDYWIMAVYEEGGDHSDVGQGITGNVVYYSEHVFGDPIPTNASDFVSYTGQDFLYFLDITCTLGIEDSIEELVSVYPNPVSNKLNIELPTTVEVIKSALFDIIGNDTGLSIENNSINTLNLEKGIYILTIETTLGSLTKKIIKN